MSPLIDVTNSGGRNCITADQPNKKIFNLQKSHVTNESTHAVVDTSKASEVSRKSSKLEHTKMCNTCVKNSFGGDTKSNESLRGNCLVDSMRVPPLPQASADDVLSQAVQALNLGPLTVHTKPNARLNRHRKLGSREIGKSSSGHPENTNRANAVRTPQQCGACGLEFTSLPVLTQHLARHVYDGLYAAQWLTQAMALVSSRQHASEGVQTTVHSVPSSEGENSESQNTQSPSGCNS
ncbi:uncharacterized protein [Palaemon carinicauda]|uniref:uncharacterized protein n=1 Tax=Palaemon carinicauda TaxID=392227 RepID=UPI0035B65053